MLNAGETKHAYDDEQLEELELLVKTITASSLALGSLTVNQRDELLGVHAPDKPETPRSTGASEHSAMRGVLIGVSMSLPFWCVLWVAMRWLR